MEVIIMTEQEQYEEDLLFAQVLAQIKNAVLSADWNLVCVAYNRITDEDLQPPAEKPKSKKERIKALLEAQQSDTVEEVIETIQENTKELTVSQLKEYAKQLGAKSKGYSGKNKEQLLDLIKKYKAAQEPEIVQTNETEIQGGKRFGLGTIKIIDGGFDPVEVELNKKTARVRKPVEQRTTAIEDTTNTDKDFRFNANPPRPTWR
jgi:HPt (histidine-containing phosphotransfer) domain-containing protein